MSGVARGTIIVIDDDATTLELFDTILRGSGYEVYTYGDARLAINMIRSIAVDLVITDLVMPEQEGLETTGQLRKEFPNIKVLVASGRAEYFKAASLLGADECLLKPIEPSVLRQKVSNLLAK